MVDAVLRFDVDLGLIEGSCRGEALEIEPWMEDEMVIVAAPDHPLAHGRVSHAALRQAAWLMREPGSGTRELIDSRIAAAVGPCMSRSNSGIRKRSSARWLRATASAACRGTW